MIVYEILKKYFTVIPKSGNNRTKSFIDYYIVIVSFISKRHKKKFFIFLGPDFIWDTPFFHFEPGIFSRVNFFVSQNKTGLNIDKFG